jgi:hypothetical protein
LLALAPLALASPVFAQGQHFGGGGGGGGGNSEGGHASSGGHTSAPSNAGGGGHAFAAPHFAARPNFGGAGGGYRANANYAPSRVNYAPARVNYAPAHAVNVNNTITHGGANVAHVAPGYAGPGYAGRGYAGGTHLAPGRYVPGSPFRYGHWNGGYWNGGFWPPVFWGANFAWFLPALPAFAATYYWNSVPYYYYNDVYYTYDPSASGYVVTTPPPAQDAAPADAPNASAQDPNDSNSAPIPSGVPANSGGLYAYPKSGQSDEQQSTDRQECARWASGQTGADGNGTSMDYQRALTACLQGRGYSVD